MAYGDGEVTLYKVDRRSIPRKGFGDDKAGALGHQYAVDMPAVGGFIFYGVPADAEIGGIELIVFDHLTVDLHFDFIGPQVGKNRFIAGQVLQCGALHRYFRHVADGGVGLVGIVIRIGACHQRRAAGIGYRDFPCVHHAGGIDGRGVVVWGFRLHPVLHRALQLAVFMQEKVDGIGAALAIHTRPHRLQQDDTVAAGVGVQIISGENLSGGQNGGTGGAGHLPPRKGIEHGVVIGIGDSHRDAVDIGGKEGVAVFGGERHENRLSSYRCGLLRLLPGNVEMAEVAHPAFRHRLILYHPGGHAQPEPDGGIDISDGIGHGGFRLGARQRERCVGFAVYGRPRDALGLIQRYGGASPVEQHLRRRRGIIDGMGGVLHRYGVEHIIRQQLCIGLGLAAVKITGGAGRIARQVVEVNRALRAQGNLPCAVCILLGGGIRPKRIDAVIIGMREEQLATIIRRRKAVPAVDAVQLRRHNIVAAAAVDLVGLNRSHLLPDAIHRRIAAHGNGCRRRCGPVGNIVGGVVGGVIGGVIGGVVGGVIGGVIGGGVGGVIGRRLRGGLRDGLRGGLRRGGLGGFGCPRHRGKARRHHGEQQRQHNHQRRSPTGPAPAIFGFPAGCCVHFYPPYASYCKQKEKTDCVLKKRMQSAGHAVARLDAQLCVPVFRQVC